ncbi:hypothetical protein VTP01DRAFT_3703 [Rhizomucor pusillus]|uniref:uncharacterized protein n=1 Tax=Rhizomucor pusillus TaxID=4840 RepID=UPI003744054E
MLRSSFHAVKLRTNRILQAVTLRALKGEPGCHVYDLKSAKAPGVMAEYAYDEEGFNFYYFLLSVLSLCLVPVTLHSLYGCYAAIRTRDKQSHCYCETCDKERRELKKARSKRAFGQIVKPKYLFIIAGWIAVALLAYQVSFAEQPKQHWDPYEILGISEGATLPEIKKVYKKLSLIYHPDKAKPGTEQESEERFIQISKAYQVLTDEEVRKNYEMYGHPDGKQSFSMGVALPKNLVEGSNSRIVLAFYACIFGLGLPYYIARWWYNSRRHTKDRILNATMRSFVKELKENAEFKDLVQIVAGAQEFRENTPLLPADVELLRAIDSTIKEELENKFGEKYEIANESVPGYRRKARTLLFAHLLRIDFNNKEASAAEINHVRADQRFVVEKTAHLLQGLLQISIVKNWLAVSMNIMDLQQHLLQATYPGEPSILQLPHVTTSNLRRYYRAKKKHIHSVQQFLAMPEEARRSLLKPSNDQQYLDAIEVANRIPKLNIEKAVFRVLGDKIITPGAVVTFILKLKNGEVSVKEGESEDNDDDLLQEDGQVKEIKLNGTLPLAHVPYYPGEKKPCWWILLGDPKVNRIIVPPKKVTDITDEQIIQITFPGPPKPGVYSFSVFIKSDTYAGTDIMKDVKLVIRDKSELPPEEEVDDSISEPEEDSIAGQMKLMREQGLASALAGGSQKNQKAAAADDDSDSDSSDDE